jgi:hypothetical protein
VRATAAASGGETGLPTEHDRQPSVFRGHPLATGIAAGVVAVVLISGLTAWGVGAAVTASLAASTGSEMPMSMPTTTPTPGSTGGTGKMATSGRIAFRATIQSIDGQSMDGASWTILTKKGKTVAVTVDDTTQFGTTKAPATVGTFAVGDSVVIVAMRGSEGVPVATRIV